MGRRGEGTTAACALALCDTRVEEVLRVALLLSVVIAACGGGLAVPSSRPTDPIGTTTATPAPTPAPTESPSPAPSVTPLPTPVPSTPAPTPAGPAAYCAVDDVATPDAAYADHARTYLDWTYALPKTYFPPDLVNASTGGPAAGTFGVEAVGAAEVMARRGDPSYTTLLTDAPGANIRQVAYGALAAMRAAALGAGHPLVILSAFRSYDLQVLTFNYWVGVGGYEQALRTSARPGHSEHQLGTTLDFGDGSAAPWEYTDWATTPTGTWLAAHAVEFGFVMSFPKGKTDVTCYDYEPWHYRYVGKDLAAAIAESRVTLREYQARALR